MGPRGEPNQTGFCRQRKKRAECLIFADPQCSLWGPAGLGPPGLLQGGKEQGRAHGINSVPVLDTGCPMPLSASIDGEIYAFVFSLSSTSEAAGGRIEPTKSILASPLY